MALAYRRDAKTTEPRIPATDARVHFGELLQHLTDSGETVLVERNGHEIAAIVPIETYRRERPAHTMDWRAELEAVQREFRRILDPTVLVNAAAMIREGHEESDAWMDDALSRR
jgi:prevent-host-death family protein